MEATNQINLICLPNRCSVVRNRDNDYTVLNSDIIVFILSIIFRPISIILNLLLACQYYRTGNYNYFLWTLSCIIIPMIVTTTIQIAM